MVFGRVLKVLTAVLKVLTAMLLFSPAPPGGALGNRQLLPCLLYLVSCFFFSQFDQVFAGKQNKWSLSSSAVAVIISIRMTYGFDN